MGGLTDEIAEQAREAIVIELHLQLFVEAIEHLSDHSAGERSFLRGVVHGASVRLDCHGSETDVSPSPLRLAAAAHGRAERGFMRSSSSPTPLVLAFGATASVNGLGRSVGKPYLAVGL